MGVSSGYKDILVVADGTKRGRGRIELTASLAERFDAHLIGLYPSILGDARGQSFYDVPLLDPVYRDFTQRVQEETASAQALFEEIAGRRGPSREWREARGNPSQITGLHGRYVDLIVLGQLDPDEVSAPLSRPLPEEVALEAGRPVLVIPYVGNFPEVGGDALVAWDGSRSATRAVNDAMPLLAAARSVTVLTIDRKHPTDHGAVSGCDIALHLARHGVTAQVETLVSVTIGIGEMLLSRAADLSADLLVMGAYGHSRVRELILGGVTRTIIESMILPVLMAH
jgi:nucleotide-binding universal stress UspA family protein